MSDTSSQKSNIQLALDLADREREAATTQLALLQTQLAVNKDKIANLLSDLTLTQARMEEYHKNLPKVERNKKRADERLNKLKDHAEKVAIELAAERKVQEYLEELQRDDENGEKRLKDYVSEVLHRDAEGYGDSDSESDWSVLEKSTASLKSNGKSSDIKLQVTQSSTKIEATVDPLKVANEAQQLSPAERQAGIDTLAELIAQEEVNLSKIEEEVKKDLVQPPLIDLEESHPNSQESVNPIVFSHQHKEEPEDEEPELENNCDIQTQYRDDSEEDPQVISDTPTASRAASPSHSRTLSNDETRKEITTDNSLHLTSCIHIPPECPRLPTFSPPPLDHVYPPNVSVQAPTPLKPPVVIAMPPPLSIPTPKYSWTPEEGLTIGNGTMPTTRYGHVLSRSPPGTYLSSGSDSDSPSILTAIKSRPQVPNSTPPLKATLPLASLSTSPNRFIPPSPLESKLSLGNATITARDFRQRLEKSEASQQSDNMSCTSRNTPRIRDVNSPPLSPPLYYQRPAGEYSSHRSRHLWQRPASVVAGPRPRESPSKPTGGGGALQAATPSELPYYF